MKKDKELENILYILHRFDVLEEAMYSKLNNSNEKESKRIRAYIRSRLGYFIDWLNEN